VGGIPQVLEVNADYRTFSSDDINDNVHNVKVNFLQLVDSFRNLWDDFIGELPEPFQSLKSKPLAVSELDDLTVDNRNVPANFLTVLQPLNPNVESDFSNTGGKLEVEFSGTTSFENFSFQILYENPGLASFIGEFSATVETNIDSLSQVDSLALAALYNSTQGPNWTNNSNWLDGPLNTWHGVTVTDKRVTSLVLGLNNLSGILPDELGNITKLESLLLGANQIEGPIPPKLGNLHNLTSLRLGGNDLTGSIPPELANTNLGLLELLSNQLTGPIPPELATLTNLEYLDLTNNQLTGSIPAQLGNLDKLRYLSLWNNQLSGSIPPQLGNLTNLEELWLLQNQLTGSIPAELGSLTKLRRSFLNENKLTGTIPSEIGNLDSLEFLSLFQNQLTGPIPASLLSLNNFELDIWSNFFDFADIVPLISILGSYAPQRPYGQAASISMAMGQSTTLDGTVGGTGNQYQWQKDDSNIPGANSPTYTISNFTSGDVGVYKCFVTNPGASDLTMESEPINVSATGG